MSYFNRGYVRCPFCGNEFMERDFVHKITKRPEKIIFRCFSLNGGYSCKSVFRISIQYTEQGMLFKSERPRNEERDSYID